MGVTTIYWVQCAYDLHARPRSSGRRLRQMGMTTYLTNVEVDLQLTSILPYLPKARSRSLSRVCLRESTKPETAERPEHPRNTEFTREKKKKQCPSQLINEVYVQYSGVRCVRSCRDRTKVGRGNSNTRLQVKVWFDRLIDYGFGPPDEPTLRQRVLAFLDTTTSER